MRDMTKDNLKEFEDNLTKEIHDAFQSLPDENGWKRAISEAHKESGIVTKDNISKEFGSLRRWAIVLFVVTLLSAIAQLALFFLIKLCF